MTGVTARLTGFVAVLAGAFAAALGLGAAVGPALGAAADPVPATASHAEPAGGDGGDHDAAALPGGLAVSQDGYTLVPAAVALEAGREQAFRFTIQGPDGLPVQDYTLEHDQELHLIVVRRDLTAYQHLHPTRDDSGTWSVPLVLDPGEHRAFTDFVPAGGEPIILGVDLRAAGSYQPRALPAPSRTAEVDGYTVTLDGDLVAGTSSDLTLSVTRDGEPVTDLQPYLGAYGHLVALRAGDLAYLHVHPGGGPDDTGPGIAFAAEVPTAGTYRLFLDFRHGGVVRTAELTATAVAREHA